MPYCLFSCDFRLHICVVGMASKSAVDITETSSKVHFSGFHQMDGLVSTRPEEMVEEEEHGQPFVIGERRSRFDL